MNQIFFLIFVITVYYFVYELLHVLMFNSLFYHSNAKSLPLTLTSSIQQVLRLTRIMFASCHLMTLCSVRSCDKN